MSQGEEHERSHQSKHYIPLESNPRVFTQLIHNLGLTGLEFQDVVSLDDPSFLDLVPRPVFGLVLVFPTTEAYKKYRKQDEKRKMYEGEGEDEDIVWYDQTIKNACGLYGALHIVSNGKARSLIPPSSSIGRLLNEITALGALERARALESNKEIQSAFTAAGMEGDTKPPARAEDEVDYHYVAFASSHKSGKVYELDAALKGPIDTGIVLDEKEDMLSEKVLKIVKGYFDRENKPGGDIGFSLLALVPCGST